MTSAVSPVSPENAWIGFPGWKPRESIVAGYTLQFSFSDPRDVCVQVAADQQYELFLDGRFLGRGGESGDPDNWYGDTYELELGPGAHVLAAKVWSWGGDSNAMAQMEVFHGWFLTSPSRSMQAQLGTGLADWRVRILPGVSFSPHFICPNGWTGVPPSQTLDARAFPWDWPRSGNRAGLIPDIFPSDRTGLIGKTPRTHRLVPASIGGTLSGRIRSGTARFVSSQVEENGGVRESDDLGAEHEGFTRFIQGGEISLGARDRRRVILDLQNYYCAHPTLVATGGKGCRVRLTWAESLFRDLDGMEKGDRNLVFEKYFRGIWDEFLLDGTANRSLTTLTWRAGRYLEVLIETGEEPVTLSLSLEESRRNLPIQDFFRCDNQSLNGIIPISVRALQMSSHDTFVDCPFYERLSYSGDGRLEALVSYAVLGDDHLARKAIQLFASSASYSGLCMARWPSRQIQYIPSFALWWIGMVYDFCLWRDDRSLVRAVLPALRSTLAYFLSRLNSDGLFPEEEGGWNFVDWVPEWTDHPDGGVPPSQGGTSAVMNWILAYGLSFAAEIEAYAGDAENAQQYRTRSAAMATTLKRLFWNPERRMFADDSSGQHFSEHSQIMAVLCGAVPPEEQASLLGRMPVDAGLIRSSLYFTHYLFEASFQAGCETLFFERLKAWNGFIAQGFCTVPENFQNTRSDCHGWGSHPLYHFVANLAGIRPAGMGFKQVRIAPRFGRLQEIKASCPHPEGAISVQLNLKEAMLRAEITLPACLRGEFIYNNSEVEIGPGTQIILMNLEDNSLEKISDLSLSKTLEKQEL